MTATAQREQILHHLEQRGSITPMEALTEHGCMRLAARVNELRAAGHHIKTTIERGTNGKKWARYALVRPGQGWLF